MGGFVTAPGEAEAAEGEEYWELVELVPVDHWFKLTSWREPGDRGLDLRKYLLGRIGDPMIQPIPNHTARIGIGSDGSSATHDLGFAVEILYDHVFGNN